MFGCDKAATSLRFPLDRASARSVSDDEGRGEDLDRDIATQFRVARAIDLAHATGTDRRDDFVDAECVSRPSGSWARIIAGLSPRTSCIFRPELSSLRTTSGRRMPRMVSRS